MNIHVANTNYLRAKHTRDVMALYRVIGECKALRGPEAIELAAKALHDLKGLLATAFSGLVRMTDEQMANARWVRDMLPSI